jgi:hypothetical protein
LQAILVRGITVLLLLYVAVTVKHWLDLARAAGSLGAGGSGGGVARDPLFEDSVPLLPAHHRARASSVAKSVQPLAPRASAAAVITAMRSSRPLAPPALVWSAPDGEPAAASRVDPPPPMDDAPAPKTLAELSPALPPAWDRVSLQPPTEWARCADDHFGLGLLARCAPLSLLLV